MLKNKRSRCYGCSLASLLVIIGLFWSSLLGNKGALRHQRLYLTPANVLQGGYYRTNTVSPAFVYGFAYQMFVAINTWSTNANH